MNTLQIKYFFAVSARMSFTGAAESLYVSQPAVSKQIAMLEHELGVRLFERSRARGLRLTAAGELYLEMFRRFSDELAVTASRVEKLVQKKKQTVKLGIVEGWELPHAIRGIFERQGVAILWNAYPFRELAEKLLKGELDMVASIPIRDLKNMPRMNALPLTELRGVFLFSAEHRRAGEHFCISDLAGDCMYLLENPEGPPVDKTRLLGALGFDPEVRFMPNRDSILLAMSGGEGFAFFDEWIRYRNYPGFQFLYSGTMSGAWLYWRDGSGEDVRDFAQRVSRAVQAAIK